MRNLAQHPKRAGRPDLLKLHKKIIRSFTLAILGSWGLIISRLNILHAMPEEFSPEMLFWIDLASLSAALFGIFSVVWYNSLLSPRLKRLSELGESGW